LEDSGVDGRIILQWIFERLDGGYRLDRSGSESGQVAESCDCGDEPPGFHKMRGISSVAQDVLASQEGLCFM
jgi:hypothetical protein